MGGYTKMVANMLEGIEVRLERGLSGEKRQNGMHWRKKLFIQDRSMPILIMHMGYLEYRSVRFET